MKSYTGIPEKIKMKQFDLQAALRGEKVVTRYGMAIEIEWEE